MKNAINISTFLGVWSTKKPWFGLNLSLFNSNSNKTYYGKKQCSEKALAMNTNKSLDILVGVTLSNIL